jgi:serine/threonine-protein kinase
MKTMQADGLPEDLSLFEDDPDEPVSLLPLGSLIGDKYVIKRVLGSGGNGAVYEGEHTAIGHRVAIKVARLSQKERAHALARFTREARICGSLRHPNVGQVYDVGMLEDGSPYMVMELQEGRSLAEVFDEMQLPIAALVDITRQLLAGLAAVHATGVIHRDIKPDNVMIVRDVKGEVVVKLVDFGISKALRADAEGRAPEDDVIIGSPDYMAPEQFRGRELDVRTDLYAVGVLLYEGITGRLPFTGESMADLLISVFQQQVQPPSAVRTDCPPELERIVLAAMSRDPVQRPESADQMSRTLDQLGGTRQEARSNLTGLDEQPRERRPTSGHRRRTADLRTLQDLGAKVEQRPHVSRAPRKAWLVAGGVAALALIAVLSHSRSAPVAEPASAAPARAPSAAPPRQAPAAPATIVTEPQLVAPTEAGAAVVVPAASEPVRSRAPSGRTMPARAPRRATTPSPSTRATAPAAPAAAPAKTSAADATATTALFREAAIAFVHGDAARSHDLYLQVLARDPARADAYRGLGLASARLGRRAEAARAFERYLQMRPDAADAARIRAELAKLR